MKRVWNEEAGEWDYLEDLEPALGGLAASDAVNESYGGESASKYARQARWRARNADRYREIKRLQMRMLRAAKRKQQG
jgi:hypothetical protein